MMRNTRYSLIALIVAAAGAPAPAQRPQQSAPAAGLPAGVRPGISPVAVDPREAIDAAAEVQQIQEQLVVDEAELAAVQTELAQTREQVKTGAAPTGELPKLEANLKARARAVAQARSLLARARRHADLTRPIDIRLQDATVRQAAEALAQASGIEISVDKSVPAETRLTVEGRRVPLATVLESVGRQGNLVIAPTPNGVQLTAPPSLSVNREQRFFKGPNFPWAPEWGTPPTAPGYGSSPFEFGGASAFFRSDDIPGIGSRLSQYTRASSGGGFPAGSLALTSVGNELIVVAEPGSGPSGEAGAWLTVYRLGKDGARMTKVGSTFHRLLSSTPRSTFLAPRVLAVPRRRRGAQGAIPAAPRNRFRPAPGVEPPAAPVP